MLTMQKQIKKADMLTKIKTAIALGIDYLYDHQYPSGEFCCYFSWDEAIEKWSRPDSTVFPSALITGCLLNLPHTARLEHILDRAGAFLWTEMMNYEVWGHYAKGHRLYRVCPADVDDTALASHALSKLGLELDNKQLLFQNRNNNGLFYTWFVLRFNKSTNIKYWKVLAQELKVMRKAILLWLSYECSRNDIDAAVNANVIYYLQDYTKTKDVTSYLSSIIIEAKESNSDKWYLNPFTLYYTISRNYPHCRDLLRVCRTVMIERILSTQTPSGSFGISVLDTALGISSLLFLECEDVAAIDQAVNYLLAQQGEKGDWERRIFYYGGPKKLVGWGSEELTTGFCLEALGLYARMQDSNQ